MELEQQTEQNRSIQYIENVNITLEVYNRYIRRINDGVAFMNNREENN